MSRKSLRPPRRSYARKFIVIRHRICVSHLCINEPRHIVEVAQCLLLIGLKFYCRALTCRDLSRHFYRSIYHASQPKLETFRLDRQILQMQEQVVATAGVTAQPRIGMDLPMFIQPVIFDQPVNMVKLVFTKYSS